MLYIQIQNEGQLPDITHLKPFKCVVIIEQDVLPEWREKVSKWLVHSGCVYMIAWGKDCSLWDDAVDMENLEQFQYNEIPDESFVMTTWHDQESLEEVFWFAKHAAAHDIHKFLNTVILHISKIEKELKFKTEYENI